MENQQNGTKGGVRYLLAKAVSGVITWGLVHIARREAGNFPGKMALYVDPHVIAHAAAAKLTRGSIVVVGTNGKTTVNNLIADALCAAGFHVACNRSGANLDSGIATALLRTRRSADWGVFESDELWLAKSLPELKARYVVLLNLFRDQLDRCGEIDIIQDSIVGTLAASPETVLIYNADDPLCAMVAKRAAAIPERAGVESIAFGTDEDMELEQNIVSDCTMCQNCSHMLEYKYRQYGQLGAYKCPECGFERPSLDFYASKVEFRQGSLSFNVEGARARARAVEADKKVSLHANLSGSYMVYNLLAVFVAAHTIGCSVDKIQRALDAFKPNNGRLQEYLIAGHSVLLNLAKNPTGFNQNLRIIAKRLGGFDADKPAVAAFFINDKEADGHDISWIWDIDFEELAGFSNLIVFAGGIRRCDLQVRLKYAGISAALVSGAREVINKAPEGAPVYVITNYTALSPVHGELDGLAKGGAAIAASASGEAGEVAEVGEGGEVAEAGEAGEGGEFASGTAEVASTAPPSTPITIAHLFPDLLNLYGDGGNVRILQQRLIWRNIPVDVKRITYGESVDLSQVDLVFLGGGPDKEQRLAADELKKLRDSLAKFADEGGPILAICGGYQILGNTWLLGDEELPGLGIIDANTKRPGASTNRLVDNIVLKSRLAKHPVAGYENHAGRTYLGRGEEAFGKVVSHTGKGNNEETSADGVIHGGIIGTYLHGPLLSKNPEVADWLLARALERHAARTGESAPKLTPLDDAEELAANAYISQKLC